MFDSSPISLLPNPGSDEGTHLLLIVEDEQSLLRAFAHSFERSGYRVLQAIDVPAALAHWATDADRISMVISDVQMPGPPIEELIAEIRRREPSPPILLISGELGRTEQRISDLMRSVNGFLAKPMRIEALRLEVERHLAVLPPR